MSTKDKHNDSIKQNNCDIYSLKQYHYTGIIISCLIVLICMGAMYMRCEQNVLLGDDLFYRYVLPAEELTTPNIGKQVSSLGDAFESQCNQYFHTNGRFPVHIVVQLLSGAYPTPAFAIVSSILIAAVIIMFIRYTLNKRSRMNPLWWMITALIWFYLFPASDHLWYEVATGMNYLFPMVLVLAWLLMWRELMTGKHHSWVFVVLTSIVGLMAGWSQEGFSVPLSGGMFIYAIINRRTLRIRHYIPLISLWIGTAALVFAPGNHHRVSDGGGLVGHLLNGINLYTQIYLLWITVAIIIVAICYRKSVLRDHIKEYAVVWYTTIIAILFGFFANTYPQSFSGIEFFSIIIGISLISKILPSTDKPWQVWGEYIVSILLLIAFSSHQWLIIKESISVKNKTLAFIEDYKHSSDGIMTLDTWDINPIARPWVNVALRHDAGWALYSLSVAYADNSKPILILTGTETEILNNPDRFFSQSYLIPGSAHAYLSNKIWIKGNFKKPLTATLVRSNRQLTEKVINHLTKSVNKKFTTKLQPQQTFAINSSDTFTVYQKPSFDIVRLDKE